MKITYEEVYRESASVREPDAFAITAFHADCYNAPCLIKIEDLTSNGEVKHTRWETLVSKDKSSLIRYAIHLFDDIQQAQVLPCSKAGGE